MINQHIVFETEGRIANITLSRADVRNAFDPRMITELTHAFSEVARDKHVAAVILRGEGKSFSSGADLSYMKAMAAYSFDENEKDARALDQMFWAMRTCPIPILAKVQGHVMGGAVGLTALSDIAFAVRGTQFAFSEVRLGLAPAVISPYVLEKMSAAQARRFMLTGEIFGCDEALQSGLVQKVGSDEEADEFIAETAKLIAANGSEAVRATKSLLREIAATSDWALRRDLTTTTIAERRVSDEGQEGLKAFLEKRQAKWST